MILAEVIFYVSGVDKSRKFYQKLGFEIIKDHGDYVGMSWNDDRILLSLNSDSKHKSKCGNGACVYKTDDLVTIHQQWSSAAKNHVSEISKADWGKYFSCKDFDGNTIEVMEG